MSKHTPGPWKVYSAYGSLGVEAPSGHLATLGEYEEASQDARLIAAAPDMLDALKGMRAYLSDNLDVSRDQGSDKEAIGVLDRAITQAEGNSDE
jgi:hypothetical protein